MIILYGLFYYMNIVFFDASERDTVIFLNKAVLIHSTSLRGFPDMQHVEVNLQTDYLIK